jgi:hypothetical protein
VSRPKSAIVARAVVNLARRLHDKATGLGLPINFADGAPGYCFAVADPKSVGTVMPALDCGDAEILRYLLSARRSAAWPIANRSQQWRRRGPTPWAFRQNEILQWRQMGHER